MNESLASAFEQLAGLLSPFPEGWWIIGSAALDLHDISGLAVADIDILVPSTERAFQIVSVLDAEICDMEPHPKFHSDLFAKADIGGIAVEVMSGFAIMEHGRFCPLVPGSREPFCFEQGRLFAPSLDELAEILARFARPKDRERLALIEAQRGLIG